MKKAEIVNVLTQKYQALYNWLETHPDERWLEGPQGKWSTGEHVVHLLQSEKALNKALLLPKFYLKYKFGTNNRENRTYDQVVEKYKAKLLANPGAVASISKVMPKLTIADKKNYISKLEKEQMKLIKKLQKWASNDLDTFLLPHPLMGRMTIREITMWTAYHTEHHHTILKNNY